MRLLNVETMELESFHDRKCPKYAILSHTWGEGEVSFETWDTLQRGAPLEGHTKILGFCATVIQHCPEVKYGWVDTCCIDKERSAELSEAINSMYRWYEQAVLCIVHLADVTYDPNAPTSVNQVCCSRWFTRGWTLQELIAPRAIIFVDRNWNHFDDLRISAISEITHRLDYHDHFVTAIAEHTGIPEIVLTGRSEPSEWSVANRMSWSSQRQTTRVEDEAYCLLGLFDVSLPLIYGEGRRAFIRLQEEIVRRSTDHSILLHRLTLAGEQRLFATSPADFIDTRGQVIAAHRAAGTRAFEVTNVGLRISLPLIECGGRHGVYHALLDCYLKDHHYGPLGLTVRAVTDENEREIAESSFFELIDHGGSDSDCHALHVASYVVALQWPKQTTAQHITILRGSWEGSRTSMLSNALGMGAFRQRHGVLVDIFQNTRRLQISAYSFVGNWLGDNRLPAIYKPSSYDPEVGAVVMTIESIGKIALCMIAGLGHFYGLAIIDIGSQALSHAISPSLLLHVVNPEIPQVWRCRDVELAVALVREPAGSKLDLRLTVTIRRRGRGSSATNLREIPRFPFDHERNEVRRRLESNSSSHYV